MRVGLFDFVLPPERIALRPCEPREAARLLVIAPPAAPDDRYVGDLPSLLEAGDVLVVNDTKVVPARLHGVRRRGDVTARVEAMLHKREDAATWAAFLRPAKKLAVGETLAFGSDDDPFDATLVARGPEGEGTLRFARAGPDLDAGLARHGAIPLPPYIAGRRAMDEQDARDYQTTFARHAGAVAAPTAGLHFTPSLLVALAARDVAVETVTLHVGAGTFLPVKAEDTAEHRMHAEWGTLAPDAADRLNDAHRAGRRIVAAGTTSLRLLETATGDDGIVRPFTGDTAIFITPGYRFRAVDMLLTNFHLPRSTLFMLVSAFSGLATMQAAYAHAIAENYRFYSYGDACLLSRAP